MKKIEKNLPNTLAERLQYLRNARFLTVDDLSHEAAIDKSIIEDLEAGVETFLAVNIRQKLARVLKVPPVVLKEVEWETYIPQIPQEIIDSLKESILMGAKNLTCPRCRAKLIVEVVTLYDLNDEPAQHSKARCSKCVFQLSS